MIMWTILISRYESCRFRDGLMLRNVPQISQYKLKVRIPGRFTFIHTETDHGANTDPKYWSGERERSKTTNSYTEYLIHRSIVVYGNIWQWYSTWGTCNPGVCEDILVYK
jgi:hypothetical protein